MSEAVNRALRVLLGAIALVCGTVIGGAMVAWLRLPAFPPMPGDTRSPGVQFALMMAAAPFLTASLLPLAEGMGGRWAYRCLALAALLFAALGLGTVIELSVFSTLFPDGNLLVSALFIPPALLTAAVMTRGNGSRGNATAVRPRYAGWLWRILLAWLAFPAIYFLFGLLIAPIVTPYYTSGVGAIRVPPIDAIIRTQLVRSLMFLVVSLPCALLWTKSRGAFIVALGLAHAVAVGAYQLAQATFMPAVVRITHSVEIALDSFAYAAVLGALFVARFHDAERARHVADRLAVHLHHGAGDVRTGGQE